MKRVILLAVAAALLLNPVVLVASPDSNSPGGSNAMTQRASSLSDLVIERVALSDYRLPCRAVGGETVDILVLVRNHASVKTTGDFTVSIYLDQNTFLDSQGVTDTITRGKSKRVHFFDIPIQAGLGAHTLDGYLNDDGETRHFCTFRVTPLGINCVGEPSLVQISWGQMQAGMAEQEVTVTEHGGGNVQMAVSYAPYFVQVFPIWAKVSVVQSPSWLTVSPAQVQFPLQRGETETDDIALAMTDDVETGTVGLVEMEVEGRTTILPSLLAINAAHATFIVEVA
ncbi:MAG: hypothetical protein R6U10_04335 [Thermoplasmatota archaeon]